MSLSPVEAFELEMIAMTVHSAHPRVGSLGEFRDRFAEHLTLVCSFDTERVSRALAALDASEFELPPALIFSMPPR